MLKLYNTRTRTKEEFKPITRSEVKMYSCGPTVYSFQHIGNMRAYIFSDIVKRTLLFHSYAVKHVINITDVGHLTSDADEGDDKVEKAAQREGKTAQEVTSFYFNQFHQDIKKLNILEPTIWAKATDHIQEQIQLIQTLEQKGYTYTTSDGVYFDTSRFKSYGALARLRIEELKAGKRVSLGSKKHKTDFALWKFSTPSSMRQQKWNSPWGKGFPGWHIECSAMSMKYLGQHFDIHTGGEDHIPVHHTNEIAQSEAATGKRFVNYWMHGAFLVNKDGEKVSKSKGGLYTIQDLETQGFNPLDFRYLVLLTHYRKPLQFTLDHLSSAQNALKKLHRKVQELRNETTATAQKNVSTTYQKEFVTALDDDLNIPKAIQVLHKLVDDRTVQNTQKRKLIEEFDTVLGLNLLTPEKLFKIPEEIQTQAQARDKYRAEKNWRAADEIRKALELKGYHVEDTPQGTKVEKVKP